MKKRSLIFMLYLCAVSLQAEPAYNLEKISLPEGVDPQIGGLAFMPDGRLMVSFNYGKIFSYQPATKEWKLFAEGLHMPLGILAINDREIIVMQRPELTKIIDKDGDGVADSFRKVCDDFGLSGNYHEFSFGPIKDKEGNLYVVLGAASNGAGVSPEVRGEFRSYDVKHEELYKNYDKTKISRMYACVPFRGWVMKITPEGEMIPFASGLRSPNGIGLDKDGRILVTDNQGDWLGSSKLHHIEEGKFHGHVPSLVWDPKITSDPMEMPVEELDKMRKKAAAFFPQGMIANSPSQPLLETSEGKFGPFGDQMIVGEMNLPQLVRFVPDEVGGILQGAMIPFLNDTNIGNGVNRLAFDKQGNLWAGKMHLSWAGGEGLTKISWNGTTPFEIHSVQLKKNGFYVRFTGNMDTKTMRDLSSIKIKSYTYLYHAHYGSPRKDETEVAVSEILFDKGHHGALLVLPEIKEGYVYQVELDQARNDDGQPLVSSMFCYTVVKAVQL